MPFYKKELAGAKNRWLKNLSEAMKHQALYARCSQCHRKGALRRIETGCSSSLRVCRRPDCRYEASS